jgi:hypothetical protein
MIFGFIQGYLVLDIEEEGYTSEDVETLWTSHLDSAARYQKVRLALRLVHDSSDLGTPKA